jgi:hypothetical protein
MTKKFLSVLAILLLINCISTVYGEESNKDLIVSIEPGSNWTQTMKILFFPIKMGPQIAAWIETLDGGYVSTITVTKSASNQKWKGNPEGGRPESLPVWTFAKNASEVDEVTSATPEKGVQTGISAYNLVPGKQYRVLIEVNSSYDFNDRWPKTAKEGDASFSGVNGQPSIIYEAVFTAEKEGTVSLIPVGKGSIDGSNGEIERNLDGITNALSIIKSATITVK